MAVHDCRVSLDHKAACAEVNQATHVEFLMSADEKVIQDDAADCEASFDELNRTAEAIGKACEKNLLLLVSSPY